MTYYFLGVNYPFKPVHQNFTNVFSSRMASKWLKIPKCTVKTVRVHRLTCFRWPSCCRWAESHWSAPSVPTWADRDPDQYDSIKMFISIKIMQHMDLCTSKARLWPSRFIHVLGDEWKYKTIIMSIQSMSSGLAKRVGHQQSKLNCE